MLLQLVLYSNNPGLCITVPHFGYHEVSSGCCDQLLEGILQQFCSHLVCPHITDEDKTVAGCTHV